MPIYSSGRRRTILILLLTSVLLITLDLRGNAVFNAARTGFSYALRPFEIAGDVITRPVERVWAGVTEVDELEAENAELRRIVDEQRSAEVAGKAALIENRRLRALLGLETLAGLDGVTGEVIGSSPSNFDQRVEIDRGTRDGVRIGMPVVTDGGLVGKITLAGPETSTVMLITDPLYAVPVKIVGEVPAPSTTTEPPVTVPSGLDVDDVTTTSSTTTTTTTSSSVPSTSEVTADQDESSQEGSSDQGSAEDSSDAGPDSSIAGVTTTSSTTTTEPEPTSETRETGGLNGQGAEDLPRVRFIADSPQFGRVREGDFVLTAGGSASLAPPGIPVGVVLNVIQNAGSGGLELEVQPNVDLDRLSFLTVILYQPPTELR